MFADLSKKLEETQQSYAAEMVKMQEQVVRIRESQYRHLKRTKRVHHPDLNRFMRVCAKGEVPKNVLDAFYVSRTYSLLYAS